MNQKIDIIAHRGASGCHPDNTLAAFAKAVALGADRIELDVQCTRDHEVVTIHDFTVDRTTNGTGYVRDLTLHELQSLDAGSWCSPVFHREHVPTLNETIVALKGAPIQLCIEIKGQSVAEAQHITSRTIEVIEAYDVIDRCVITSFIPDALILSKRRQPLIPTAWDPDSRFRFTARELWAQMVHVGGDILLQRHIWLSLPLIDEMHAYGIPIWAWTVNAEHDMKTVIDLGADGIMADYPGRLRRLLSSSLP